MGWNWPGLLPRCSMALAGVGPKTSLSSSLLRTASSYVRQVAERGIRSAMVCGYGVGVSEGVMAWYDGEVAGR